jgi:putative N6-adenine-specific DNA methylase
MLTRFTIKNRLFLEEYLDVNKTFAIDAVVFSEEFRHSKFVSYKVKDAIVDYFREKTVNVPSSVRINNPDVLLNIHIAQTTCTLSLDSSENHFTVAVIARKR